MNSQRHDPRKCPHVVALVLALLLVGCAKLTLDRETAIQGRWHRIAEPNLHDPFQSLASEYIEFRPNGVLACLLFDQGPQLFWTTSTGEYVVSDTHQVTIKGKCWQGWQSYDCSRVYDIELKGDSLTIFDNDSQWRRVEYERVGAVSSDLPPRLVPPMPSATPTTPG